jgi:hypothetical protein
MPETRLPLVSARPLPVLFASRSHLGLASLRPLTSLQRSALFASSRLVAHLDPNASLPDGAAPSGVMDINNNVRRHGLLPRFTRMFFRMSLASHADCCSTLALARGTLGLKAAHGDILRAAHTQHEPRRCIFVGARRLVAGGWCDDGSPYDKVATYTSSSSSRTGRC